MGDVRWSGRHLARTSYQMARALARIGLNKGDGVACLLPNCPEFVAFHFACGLLGLRQTFLNPLNSIEAGNCMLIAGEVKALVSHDDLAERAVSMLVGEASGVRLLSFGGRAAQDLAVLAENESAAPIHAALHPTDAFALGFTSGSTGKPKGVLQSQRVIVQLIMMTLANWEWPQTIRSLISIPITHAGGTMILPTLLRGGTLHIENGFDPQRVLATIARERITATIGVPTMIYKLLEHIGEAGSDVSSLQSFFYGASPISAARLEEAMSVFGPIFCQFYGQTEAPMNVTYLSRADHDLNRPHLLESCGQAQAGALVGLLDEAGADVGVDVEGEICVRGPLVMEGYWKDDEANRTAMEFGWLHTGDIGRRDADGYYYIVDRKKDMIVSGGFNVFPRDVEQILSSHPRISQVAVIGIPHDVWGEAVHAVVVPREGSALSFEELATFVRDRKGAIQSPKSIEFVASLPLTPVGKVDKTVLRAPHWAGRARRVN